jgi:hypothetical protein
VDLGLNFHEQWQRALECNPSFIFVTGWNEWIAGRYTQWSKYTDADCYYPGGLFVDEYTQEYSRDCEPMRGGHGDNYYYQLAAWVRRFKGVRERAMATGPSRIIIDGAFDDWRKVEPKFRDTIGDTLHRDHKGYGDLVYRNETGRNDFVILKAAYDAANVYFFAQTLDKISPRTGRNWMLLFLDVDRNIETGWLGYDYVVNLEVLSDTATTVAERRYKRDGRRARPLPPHCRVFPAQRLVLLLPGERRVGRVEHNHINPGIDQQIGVLTDNEWIGHLIVTQLRFAPMIRFAVSRPVYHSAFCCSENLRVVIRPSAGGVPCPIEDPDPLVFFHRSTFLRSRQYAPQTIRRYPGVRQHIASLIRLALKLGFARCTR